MSIPAPASRPPAPSGILFKGIQALLPRHHAGSENPKYSFECMDVLVSGNRIQRVAPSIYAPGGVQKVDGTDHILIPGFVNGHAHMGMTLLGTAGAGLAQKEWLDYVRPLEARLTPEAIGVATQLACAQMIRSGITCVNDMYREGPTVAAALEQSGLRGLVGPSLVYSKEPMSPMERLEAVLEFMRSWNSLSAHHTRVRISIAPHSVYLCEPKLLQAAAQAAEGYGLHFHIHAAETEWEINECQQLYGVHPFELLRRLGALNGRTILAHGTYVRQEHILLASGAGASVIHNPTSNFNLGNGRHTPLPTYWANGVNLGMGTDSSVSNGRLDMFEVMRSGLQAQTNKHRTAAIMSADQVIYIATEGGARAMGVNAGRIEAGYLADLTVLSTSGEFLSPIQFSTDRLVKSASPADVTDVMVDGKWVMKKREIAFDVEPVRARAQALYDSLIKPAL